MLARKLLRYNVLLPSSRSPLNTKLLQSWDHIDRFDRPVGSLASHAWAPQRDEARAEQLEP
jgi:hypothetical protein